VEAIRKCRVRLIKEEEQHQWPLRQLSEVDATSVLPYAPLYFRKGGHGGNFVIATF